MVSNEELRRVERAERELTLDDLLSRWHAWQIPDRLTNGHSGRALVCGDYQTPASYNGPVDADEAADDANNRTRMRQVDFEVRQIPDPWRSAIYSTARALYTGHAVFHSPRIAPQDRARVTAEARDKISVRLIAAGVM